MGAAAASCLLSSSWPTWRRCPVLSKYVFQEGPFGSCCRGIVIGEGVIREGVIQGGSVVREESLGRRVIIRGGPSGRLSSGGGHHRAGSSGRGSPGKDSPGGSSERDFKGGFIREGLGAGGIVEVSSEMSSVGFTWACFIWEFLIREGSSGSGRSIKTLVWRLRHSSFCSCSFPPSAARLDQSAWPILLI